MIQCAATIGIYALEVSNRWLSQLSPKLRKVLKEVRSVFPGLTPGFLLGR